MKKSTIMIEYKLQNRICFIIKLQVIMQEKKMLKNNYISYYVWGSDDKFSTLGHSQCINSQIKMHQILYQSLGVERENKSTKLPGIDFPPFFILASLKFRNEKKLALTKTILSSI